MLPIGQDQHVGPIGQDQHEGPIGQDPSIKVIPAGVDHHGKLK